MLNAGTRSRREFKFVLPKRAPQLIRSMLYQLPQGGTATG